MIFDAKLFAYLEMHMDRIVRRDAAALAYIIPRCAEIKAQVVSRDERESGLREILNFGHTFGHAFESASHYGIPHGIGVTLGMFACISMAKPSPGG